LRILLTGNRGGIGKSIENKIKSSGADVVAVNTSVCDLSNFDELSSFFNKDREYDGLIHCAGINPVAKCDVINFDELLNAFSINVFSFIKMCQEINFSNGSNIVAIGSLWATGTKEGRCQYSMTKHSLLSAVKTLALEMASKNIKVNMVSPGFVDTEMTRKNNSDKNIKEINDFIPLGLTNPNEIAKMCEYLVINNQAITGQNIIVDGGYSIKNV